MIDKRLKELGIEGKVLLLAKISKVDKYLDDFVAGNIYMNTLEFFKNLEKELKVKGQGDKYEASVIYKEAELIITDPETGENVSILDAEEITFHLDNRIKSPIFCLHSIDIQNLKVINENDKYIEIAPFLPEDELTRLINDFGKNLVYIIPNRFLERMREAANNKLLKLAWGKVKYYDYNKPLDKRFDPSSTEICFNKSDFFEYQNEYRILINNKITDDPYILNIGDISDITKRVSTRDFFSGTVKIRFEKVK